MDCQAFREQMDACLDGELSPQAREAFCSHVQACPSCQREWQAARAVAQILADWNQDAAVPLPAQAAWRNALRREARRSRVKRAVRWGASVAAAALVLVGTLQLAKDKPAAIPAEPAGTVRIESKVNRGMKSQGAGAFQEARVEDWSRTELPPVEVLAASVSVSHGSSPQVEIQSAVQVRSRDLDSSIRLVEEGASARGGRVIGAEESLEAGVRAATVVVAVPADAIDAFIAQIGTEVSRHQIDISVDVAAAASKVELLRSSIAVLEGDSSPEAEETLGKLQRELESARGELASLRKRTGMARVMVTIWEDMEEE